jgi:3-oxoacyl-[acyl-carrier-protein] synthase II
VIKKETERLGPEQSLCITGTGIISAIGVGKTATLDSLRSGCTGIGKMKYLGSKHCDIPVGEVPMSNEEMMSMLGIQFDPQLTRTALMGRIALKEALNQSNLKSGDLHAIPFISATTVGGMDRREKFYKNEVSCDRLHALIATHNCGNCTEMIAEPFGNFSMLSTVSTACSSATNALITGANMIRAGLAETVVVGGSECLTLFHLNGFNTLMILDRRLCMPFDRDRAGLNLGEGAAYLVLETVEAARKRGQRPLFKLDGYGNACDAFHQTASSLDGEGAYRAMKEALEMADLKPEDIDYVNAHGTGTPNNDESESQAIRRVFGEQLPPISSTKSFTGHTTSASGSIEAVICLLALEHQFLPLNLNWETPMENGIIPVTDMVPKGRLRHIQSNAFGFGGNDSSLIFSKMDA